MSKPNIVYWNNIPSPYVVGRFNAVAKRGNLHLEAWFNEERQNDRSWIVNSSEWRFSARYIPHDAMVGKRLHVPAAELSAVRPDVLVSLYGSPSFAAGACVGKLLASISAFRVLPTFDAWVDRTHLKEITKHTLFRGADAVKVPGPTGRAMARRYGMPDDRIFQVTQSIDVEHYASARNLSPATRSSERDRRGLCGCVFIYVGRLWSGKGLNTLFDAYEKAIAEVPDVSLLIVGDGVDDSQFRARARQLKNVHFEGFVQAALLPDVYGLADILVFPTLGDPHGLVVEEAMAAGLPVICTESAGDIRTRLPDGHAGFVVPPGNSNMLANRMKRLAKDARLREQMSGVARSLILSRSHEAYAIDFEHFVERTLNMPARTGPAPLTMRAAGVSLVRIVPNRTAAPLLTDQASPGHPPFK